jgi:hypothetical protein
MFSNRVSSCSANAAAAAATIRKSQQHEHHQQEIQAIIPARSKLSDPCQDFTNTWRLNHYSKATDHDCAVPELIPNMSSAIQIFNEIHNMTKPTFYFMGDSVSRNLAVRLAQLCSSDGPEHEQEPFNQKQAKEDCSKVPAWGSGCGTGMAEYRGGGVHL